MLTVIIDRLKKPDFILKTSFILMIISLLWVNLNTNILKSVDWKVISILFCLMVVIENLKESKLFDYLSHIITDRINDTKKLGILLSLLCFISSMLITNDVALITFVPLTILLLKNEDDENIIIDMVIIETISANLGSQFTPIGNPQNLYIYYHYNVDLIKFLIHMSIPTLISIFLIMVSVFFIKSYKLKSHVKSKINIDKKLTVVWIIAFIICLLSVIKFISYQYVLIIIIVLAFSLNIKSLKNIDYSILLTFIFLFIFINNLLQIEYINLYIVPIIKEKLYLNSVIISQIISNVPATIFIAPLTDDWKTLIYAVNISGVGTIIASMASIISYKIYTAENEKNKFKFLKRFTIYNFIFLIILGVSIFFILKIIK